MDAFGSSTTKRRDRRVERDRRLLWPTGRGRAAGCYDDDLNSKNVSACLQWRSRYESGWVSQRDGIATQEPGIMAEIVAVAITYLGNITEQWRK